MIKMLGMFCLFCACTGMGFWKSRQYQARIAQLRELMRIADFLKGEIIFAKSTLAEALERISYKTRAPFSRFLLTLSSRMKEYAGQEFSMILGQVMKETLKDTALWKEDMEEFYHTASNLGYLDKEMQIHLLDVYLHEQEQKIEALVIELPKMQKMFKSLGILGGAFFVILLI
jgi:stage III sporulation protein AB